MISWGVKSATIGGSSGVGNIRLAKSVVLIQGLFIDYSPVKLIP